MSTRATNPTSIGSCSSMKYLFISITLFLLCSCSIRRKIYSATQINNPSLQQKNDHSFSLSCSNPAGFDFTSAYAITNRLAIIGGAYSYRNNENQNESDLFSNFSATAALLYRHKGFHGGLGVYFPIVKKDPRVYASFFGGYTKGNFRMDEHYVETDNSTGATTTRESFYRSDIGRYFLQGGCNFYLSQFEFSLLSRYNYVVYSDVTTNYSTLDQYDSSLPPLGYSIYSQFLDIGFDSKYFFTDSRRIAVQVFGSFTTRLNRKEFNFLYYNTRLGLGVVIRNPFKKNN